MCCRLKAVSIVIFPAPAADVTKKHRSVGFSFDDGREGREKKIRKADGDGDGDDETDLVCFASAGVLRSASSPRSAVRTTLLMAIMIATIIIMPTILNATNHAEKQ